MKTKAVTIAPITSTAFPVVAGCNTAVTIGATLSALSVAASALRRSLRAALPIKRRGRGKRSLFQTVGQSHRMEAGIHMHNFPGGGAAKIGNQPQRGPGNALHAGIFLQEAPFAPGGKQASPA